MDRSAVLHAKYVMRRIRRIFGTDTEVVAGFWGTDDFLHNAEVASTALDAIVTSFESAIKTLEGATPHSAEEGPAHEPDLAELARLASAVIAKPAQRSSQPLPPELGELPASSGAAR